MFCSPLPKQSIQKGNDDSDNSNIPFLEYMDEYTVNILSNGISYQAHNQSMIFKNGDEEENKNGQVDNGNQKETTKGEQNTEQTGNSPVEDINETYQNISQKLPANICHRDISTHDLIGIKFFTKVMFTAQHI